MHLDLIQSLSIAGDSSKANDDRTGAGHAHAWVIDGATDLGEPGLLGNRGGAAWIAAFAEQRTRTPESWELPSASFLAVSIADNVIDCAWLGDCAALLIRDGQATRIGPQRDIRDDETDLARSVAHHGLGSIKRAAPVLDVLRTARSRPDRLVLGIDPAGAEHIYYSSQPCVAGDELLLMSDGFVAITDLYRLVDQAALPGLLAESGLSGIAAILRAAEADDAECTRWPRFKHGDDATAIWLRIAA